MAADNSTTITVFVPRGRAEKNAILKTALHAAAPHIPPAALNVKARIPDGAASDIRTDERGTEGRDYTVTITWTPRTTRASTANDEDDQPGTLDKVLDALEPLSPAHIDAVTVPAAESMA